MKQHQRIAAPLPEFDGVLFADWKIEQGHLVRRLRQPGERAILSANAELRKNPDTIRQLEWGKPAMVIPENMLAMLEKKYPDLVAPHHHTKHMAWLKFFNSAEADPFRVYHRSRARG